VLVEELEGGAAQALEDRQSPQGVVHGYE
jgi:hypothetical protein